MLTKHTKLIIGACLLFGTLGCLGVNMTNNSSGQLPRRKVDITIDTSRRQALFDQLQQFAEKHSLKIGIDTGANPSGEEFYIDMYGDDIEIHGANPFAPGEYKLGFYDADRQSPMSETVLDDLVNDLESFLREVPGATFSVEK